MRPLIGISGAWSVETWNDDIACGGYIYVGSSYVTSLQCSGACPVILPPVFSEVDFRIVEDILLHRLDGILFSGGGDARRRPGASLPPLREQQPFRYGWEKTLLQGVLEKAIPCLGICRGFQMIVESFGGSLREGTVSGHAQKAPGSRGSHGVHLVAGSRMEDCVGPGEWFVNSFHVQGVDESPRGFSVACVAEDGLCEGIEAVEHPFLMGVQFHPEELFQGGDVRSRALLSTFVEAARKKAAVG